MKVHSTNYYKTFIEIAEDSTIEIAEIPPEKKITTVARKEYDMIINHPYQYTSDDVIYATKAAPKGICRKEFFSKGQACFRASALTNRYGWGVHSDEAGKIALYLVESKEYQQLKNDTNLTHVRSMRRKKSN